MEASIIIDRLIGRHGVGGNAGRRELAGDIPDHGGGGPAFFKCCSIGQRLDGRARLAGGKGHVHLPGDRLVVVIGGTNHRQDFPGGWADGKQRAILDVLVRQRCHLVFHQFLRLRLQRRVNGGIDGEAGAVDCLWIVTFLQLGADVVHPVGIAGGVACPLEGVIANFQRGGGKIRLADTNPVHVLHDVDAALFLAEGVHQAQHLALAQQSGIPGGEDIINARRLGNARQEGCLPQGQPVSCGIEIGLCSSLNTIGEVAVVDFIQVQLQDFLLAVQAGDFRRQHDLACLAVVADLIFFIRQQQDAGELLGDGGGARNNIAAQQVAPQCPGNGNRIPAGIVVEFLVLGGDGCGNHIGRDFLQRHIGAPTGIGVNDFVQHVVIAVEDAGGLKL